MTRIGTVSIPKHGTYVVFGVLGTDLVVPALLRDDRHGPTLGRWTWVRPTTPEWFWTVRFDREVTPDEITETPLWLRPFADAVTSVRAPEATAAAAGL